MTKTKIILMIFAIALSPIVFLLAKYSYHVWDHNNKIEQGICPSIGRKLTEEEKIDYAFYYMSRSIKIDEKNYDIIRPKKPKIRRAGRILKDDKLFDYNKEEIEKFKEENPDCCTYSKEISFPIMNEDYHVNSNVTSRKVEGYVVLKYKAYYIDSFAKEIPINVVDIVAMYSCGPSSGEYTVKELIKVKE